MNPKVLGRDTRSEIYGQPELWKSVYQLILEQKADIDPFLQPILRLNDLQIILAGAGSSAFIGESAAGILQQRTGIPCRAVATTSLVTHPAHAFSAHHTTLLISFARSGNSPESLQALALAGQYCRDLYHLVITCNGQGHLLRTSRAGSVKTYCLLLPEAAHDKSLAMTGSFTAMLLSILLLSDRRPKDQHQVLLERIIRQAEHILDRRSDIKALAEEHYERVVFLGSGPMLAIARECQLKIQELTDGRIICKHDSFLGFRHGPRAVLDRKTLLVYLFSEDQHVFRYERDLVLQLIDSAQVQGTIHLGRRIPGDPSERLSISFTEDTAGYHIIPATLIGQLLGFYKSLGLGLDPDNPSISGAINRVVKGVILYEANRR